MKEVASKITFHLQNLNFYQNLQTDTSEPFSSVYNGIICIHSFWHETVYIKENPIVQHFENTVMDC